MKKASIKKRSLVMSVLSLVLCFTMLLGTTWAWFTDEVESGINQIVAGNLDVELYHSDKDAADKQVTTDTKLFDDVTLWEPGAYCYETFTVKNVGKLALKYKMAVNVGGYTSFDGHNLTEVLKVATSATAPATREDAAKLSYKALNEWSMDSEDKPLLAEESESVTVVIYWEPGDNETDNLYNMNNGQTTEALTVDLGVELVATQFTHEEDSFDKYYDAYATNSLTPVIPAENIIVPVDKEEDNTLKNLVTITTKDGKASVTAPAGTKLAEGFETLEFKLTPKELTSGITIEPTEQSAASYNIDLVGLADDNDATITLKVFVGKGWTEVKAYHEGAPMTDGTYTYDKDSGFVTVETTNFSPFDFVCSDGNVHLYNATQLKAFAAKVNNGESYKGKTVVLENDIDLQNINWTPIGKTGAPFNGTFDGQKHTVSNLKVTSGDRVGLFGYTFNYAYIKDVNVKNAELIGEHYAGAILGQGYASISGCNVENVKATVAPALQSNGSYDNGDKAGGLVGQLGEGASMGIENCSAKNVTIQGYRDIGGIIGMAQDNNYVKNNTADNVTLIQDLTNGYQDAVPTTVGGVYGREGANVVEENNNATNVTVSKVLYISTADELMAFAADVNAGNTYDKQTVLLGADIDLAGKTWKPIGGVNRYPSVTFYGTFDGQNHTISNLTSNVNEDNAAAGLFGSLMGTVQNVNLKNVDITSSHWAGGIVAYSSSSGSKVINCTVDGGTITSVPELIGSSYDNGDKAGGIFGANCEGGTITGCTVSNLTVKAFRDVGGIVGASSGKVTNNTVGENVVLAYVEISPYAGHDNENMGDYVGRDLGSVDTTGCTGTATKHGKTIVVEEKDTPELTQTAVNKAVASATDGDTVVLPNTEQGVKLPTVASGVTLKGDGTTKIDATAALPNIDDATLDGLVLECGQSTYHGFQHSDAVIKNCTIKGLLFSYNAGGEQVFENCTFINDKEGGEYNMWAYGNVSYKDCTFKSYGKFVNVYNEGTAHFDVNFDGCKFINLKDTGYKAAVNVKDTSGSNQLNITVTINNCTYEGAAPAIEDTDTLKVFNPIVQLDDIGAGPHHITIVYNGDTLWAAE